MNFVYFAEKDKLFERRRLLAGYLNNMSKKRLFINEHLSNHNMEDKQECELVSGQN